MSETLKRLETFARTWLPRLEADSAEIRLVGGKLEEDDLAFARTADRFVLAQGQKAIGPNWELLDHLADRAEPRSVRAAFVEAFARNMVFSKADWLGEAGALACCEDFLDCFDAGRLRVATNRMYFGWNPISEATFEWAFVAADSEAIALLLATDED